MESECTYQDYRRELQTFLENDLELITWSYRASLLLLDLDGLEVTLMPVRVFGKVKKLGATSIGCQEHASRMHWVRTISRTCSGELAISISVATCTMFDIFGNDMALLEET